MEETKNTTNVEVIQKPQFLKILCILSYIGTGLWALFSLIGIFASHILINFFMNIASNGSSSDMTAEQAAQMAQMASAGGGMMSIIASYIVVIFIISLILSLVSLLGVIKMSKLQKSGFWIYSSVNGLLALLSFFGNPVMSLINIAFIVMYGLNLKYMK